MDATETVMEGEAPKSAMRHLTKATAATPSMVDGAWKDRMDKLDERNLNMEEAVEADMAFKVDS
ncbi:hypothetical protein SPRG_19522 [Saprolegnia parasitica CBS 223.65]|uniref:Uncharacterized protein n=1 Tax=Saprolegnia parasitica (strain CBS 223.65) TaxID=695850 RepID=A0A067CYZ4_SAPPC|nr:hypothetical protein SPRG_19522 [Saprolegnia parasitica CBS 223.65]KDO31721.1 hypothetical protein SPRG_19522 [Saprolegnia parasitica CBS 223.65]|eukprot:XP_012197773.1 hypothetical protein SPRG_19522 [Saprolegnia parasitica CBS 223.65]